MNAILTVLGSAGAEEIVNATMFNVGDGNGIWYLIGAALVFFMQAGFAMVETGMTRAKNAGNIIMKNLMDFCIGTVTFVLIGFGLMLGEDALFGLVGIPTMDILGNFSSFDRCAEFVFNLVFCATAATIVSGAMAERTKFISYCIYSGVISAIIYPVEAHWIWGGGWLTQLGFVDFAGSTAIHVRAYRRGYGRTAYRKIRQRRKASCYSRPLDDIGRVRRVHSVVWLVRLQRCGCRQC